tara:strand:+ start:146 stop:490 length:345 start_codon:yes stop_codon:yes gene_type:complete
MTAFPPGFSEPKAADVAKILDVAFGEPAYSGQDHDGGWVMQWHFPNGYGASVICRSGTWWRPEGAVLRRSSSASDDAEAWERWPLCYSTPITGDVVPGLSYAKAYEFVASVEAL